MKQVFSTDLDFEIRFDAWADKDDQRRFKEAGIIYKEFDPNRATLHSEAVRILMDLP